MVLESTIQSRFTGQGGPRGGSWWRRIANWLRDASLYSRFCTAVLVAIGSSSPWRAAYLRRLHSARRIGLTICWIRRIR